ncbi:MULTISPECIES: hypothetical protein [unclassified Agrobacterium]|uniref:hypothetical protein n=1 Tax=unclassified Agrobacterium TaxID=2632611 RepID=UPI0004784D97|nr:MULTISPECIES: hypothetical protein [unclassified Agrobacterium]
MTLAADHIALYTQLMHEIKRRHFSVVSSVAEPHRLFFKATIVDHCYLQFRKILELIAFSVLSANQAVLSEIHGSISRDYHAEKILRAVEKRFGKVYPRPIVQLLNPSPGVKAKFENIETGYLTRSDFSVLYAQCGDVLHGRNPFRKPMDFDGAYEKIDQWSKKITVLLNSHIATIVDDPNLYLIQMNGDIDRAPTCTVFGRK